MVRCNDHQWKSTHAVLQHLVGLLPSEPSHQLCPGLIHVNLPLQLIFTLWFKMCVRNGGCPDCKTYVLMVFTCLYCRKTSDSCAANHEPFVLFNWPSKTKDVIEIKQERWTDFGNAYFPIIKVSAALSRSHISWRCQQNEHLPDDFFWLSIRICSSNVFHVDITTDF